MEIILYSSGLTGGFYRLLAFTASHLIALVGLRKITNSWQTIRHLCICIVDTRRI